ncbi:hypothetical protein [Streptomyces sp. NBC_01462]|uniref:hypothetical protein n=1 Tax=Streptomyces sp. NBC_01462 TaxID=2903876 RepID=UPI002E358454|nr:hypothetical protein [Streptomyces sp. NBC_01462]
MGTSAGGFGAADTAAEVSAADAPGTVRPVPRDVRRWTGRTGPVAATPYEDRGTDTDGADRPASAGDPPGAESTGPGTAGPGPAGMTAGLVDVGIGPAAGGAVLGPSVEGVAGEEAYGETEPERAPPAAAEAGVTEGPFSVRRGTDGVTTGSARRCTAGPAGALVSPVGAGGRVAAGGTAATLGPVGPVATTGRLACRADGAPVRSADSAGVATGKESEGSSRPEAGSAGVASTPRTRPPGAPSSTAWESVPVKDGFCQVVSRPPNPESATEPRPAVARWMGGSEGQAAGRTARAPPPSPVSPAPDPALGDTLLPVAGAAPLSSDTGTPADPVKAALPAPRSRPPPRRRSKMPMRRHLSPVPRWTSAAICSV